MKKRSAVFGMILLTPLLLKLSMIWTRTVIV